MRIGVIASMKKGLEHFIYREACGFADQGTTVSLFPTKHRKGLYNPRPEWQVHRWRAWQLLAIQPLRFIQMPFRYLSVLWTAIRYRELADFFLAAFFAPAARNVDVLYATFGDHKFFVGYFVKRLVGTPLAVEIHAHELYVSPNPQLFMVALAACDEIVAATEYNREVLRDRFGVDPQRVDVVRYAVDMNEYRPAKKFVVLIVAFFVARKGHEILFQAVKKLGHDDIEVWVVGGAGAEVNPVDVEAMAKRSGVASQVAFFGKLQGPALKAVYHACDVFCLPCRFDADGEAEGFPNVIIEAMACGKPVVTTRHVEIPRIVEQVLVDENDVDGLAEALQRVRASAELREQLGRRNRELAMQYFTPDNLVQTMRLLRKVARSNGEPATAKQQNNIGSTPIAARTSDDAAIAARETTNDFNVEPVRPSDRREVANQLTGASS